MINIEIFKSLSKYPFIYEGKFYNSRELIQNKSCVKCKGKDCLQINSEVNVYEQNCASGYDNVFIAFGKNKFIINGIIFRTNKYISNERKKNRVSGDF